MKNKVAFITGAGGYIGSETAVTLAKQGISIAVCDINEDAVKKFLEEHKESTQRINNDIAKGASLAVEAGIMGYEMMRSGHQFLAGDGIITKGVENTIYNVGKLARDGMTATDKEIIRIMLS